MVSVIAVFSTTSSGQSSVDGDLHGKNPPPTKATKQFGKWAVLVTDPVRGSRQNIEPKWNFNPRVVETDYPPKLSESEQLRSRNQPGEKNLIKKSKIPAAKSQIEFTQVATENFLPTAIRILVNPAVKRTIPIRRKDR